MEKRILVAFLLSFAVLYASRFLLPPPPPEKPVVSEVVPPPPAPVDTTPPAAEVSSGEIVQAASEKSDVVDTPLYKAVVSNAGGVLKSLQLKRFPGTAGQPAELIDPYAGSQVGFPLAITTGDAALDKTLAEARFVSTLQGNSVSLEYQAGGVLARKTLGFDPAKYQVRV